MNKFFAFVAVAMITLTSCGDKKDVKKTEAPLKVEQKSTGKLKIAFYHQDSLKANFTFYSEQDKYISNKQLAFQGELDRLTKDYQAYVQRNEKKAQQGLLSQNQLQDIGLQVQAKEKKIMEYERSKGQSLEAETIKLLGEIGKKVDTYSKKFAEENNIDILMIQAPGGQLGYISPSMDVTSEFIEYLNAQEEEIKKDIEK